MTNGLTATRQAALLDEQMDQAMAPARQRRESAADASRMRLPCDGDWATEEELRQLHDLQLRRVALGPQLQQEARERVAAKRAARRESAAEDPFARIEATTQFEDRGGIAGARERAMRGSTE